MLPYRRSFWVRAFGACAPLYQYHAFTFCSGTIITITMVTMASWLAGGP
jgi:hypothetical protein